MRGFVEFLAPVAAVRLAFREGTAKGREVAEGEKRSVSALRQAAFRSRLATLASKQIF